MCHQGMFIKRQCFKRIGFYKDDYKLLADYEWNLHAYTSGAKIIYVDDLFGHYRLGGASDSYRAIEESRSIALYYYCEKSSIDKIEEKYRKMKSDIAFRGVINNDIHLLNGLMIENDFIIWGAGYYSSECIELLRLLEKNILFIVDNNADNITDFPIEVKMASGVEWNKYENAKILVSSIAYEKSIIGNLEDLNISKVQYITLREIKMWCLEYLESINYDFYSIL